MINQNFINTNKDGIKNYNQQINPSSLTSLTGQTSSIGLGSPIGLTSPTYLQNHNQHCQHSQNMFNYNGYYQSNLNTNPIQYHQTGYYQPNLNPNFNSNPNVHEIHGQRYPDFISGNNLNFNNHNHNHNHNHSKIK